MRKEKGLSLVELILTIFIVMFVLSGAYFTYTNLLKGFKKETISIETEMEKLVSSEILRLDIEHAGYGIGINEPYFPIEWHNETNVAARKLIIRSTLNNTDNTTFGWMLFKCKDVLQVLSDSMVVDNRLDKTNTALVILNDKKEIASTSTDVRLSENCPQKGVLVGFPINRDKVNKTGVFGCLNQICHPVIYRLSKTKTNLADCNPDTRNLLRNGVPVLDCVADFKVKYWVDNNLDGKIDTESTISIAQKRSPDNDYILDNPGVFTDIDGSGGITSDELRKQLKLITVYLLVQEGKYDPEFTFENSTGYIEVDGIKLQLPKDYKHYRWKVIKLTVKPINL